MTSPEEIGFDAVGSAWGARTAAEAAQIWQVPVPEAGAWIMEFGTSNGLTGHDQDAMWSLLRSLPQVLARVQPSRLFDQPVPVDVADASDIVGALLDVDPEHEESMLAGWRFVAENSSAESISDLATTHNMFYFDACQLVLGFGRANGMTESDPDVVWKQLLAGSAERSRLIDSFMFGTAIDLSSGQPQQAAPRMSADQVLHDFDLRLQGTGYRDITKEILYRHAGQFVRWCPADTDWNDRGHCKVLRSEYLHGLDSPARIPASSATRHLLGMLAGKPFVEEERSRLVLGPWLAEHQNVLQGNGYTGARLQAEISRVRVFVRWAEQYWIGAHGGNVDWRSGSDRFEAWEAYIRGKDWGKSSSGAVRRWYNVLTGSPLHQGWEAHMSPDAWKVVPTSSSLDKFIPPPPPVATTSGQLGAQVASLAEQQSQDPANDAHVKEAKHWKFRQVDPTARPEKRARLE